MPPATEPLRPDRLALIADRDPNVRGYIRAVLAHEGFTVLEAADGEEALHRSQQYPGALDLCVADLHLPGMDGRPLPDLLAPYQRRLRVLFTSPLLSAPMVTNSDHLCLVKPFTPKQLIDAVQATLECPWCTCPTTAGILRP
jgi:CheY-like chemotaxis protein